MIKSYPNWLLKSSGSRSSIELAQDPDTAVETLADLAQDPYWRVRRAVAQHPNTAAETLARLAQDPVWQVRWWVAKHPNTAAETLARLAQDPESGVRYEVAENPNAGDEALYLLSKDEDDMVRGAALKALRPRQDQEMKSWGWDQEAIDLIRQLGI